MTRPLAVKISRNGVEIGSYEASEAVRLLVYGTLRDTDFYWHEGMTEWAPLHELRDSEARRQLAEKELQRKQDEARRAEQLAKEKAERDDRIAREKAKAKEEEDRAVAEAVRVRMEKRKENFFTCNCCKDTFEKPVDPRGLFWKGLWLIFLAVIIFLMALALSRGDQLMVLAVLLLIVSALSAIWAAILILSSGLRSPFCPGCHSTNYSRPNKGERPVFD